MATADLPKTAAHPFYRRLNELLEEHGFDAFAEQSCEKFYAAEMGRPSLAPGVYFRSLLIGYFEGLDSERLIACAVGQNVAASTQNQALAAVLFLCEQVLEQPLDRIEGVIRACKPRCVRKRLTSHSASSRG